MILYFSGTGNSREVARMTGMLTADKVIPLTPSMRHESVTPTPSHIKRVIWVFPIYSWGVPPYVLDIIGKITLKAGSDVVHHAIVTCGDDCGLADRMWRKAISKRRWLDGCIMSVQMPNNYVAMKGFDVDSDKVRRHKLAAYPQRVNHVVSEILQAENNGRKITDIVHGSFPWIKTRIIYPWFIRHAMNPSGFAVSDSCISCGRCAATCPVKNITMTSRHASNGEKHPKWGADCAGCLACYHICPVHAVSYNSATKNKGQYFFTRS